MPPEERYATFRAKIDLLNYQKRRIKHIWEESSLSGESTEPILRGKKPYRSLTHGHQYSASLLRGSIWGQVSRPISQKRLIKNKHPEFRL